MKTKHFFVTIALTLSVLFLHAQEKYQFMIIEYSPRHKKEIWVSIDGQKFLEEKVDFSKPEFLYQNANPLLAKVNQYQEEGWELMNFEVEFYYNTIEKLWVAYMRKKKEDGK